MPHNPYLNKCIQLISEKTGWGNHETWTHPQFVDLSKLIFDDSGVLISVSSLKRLFGKVSSTHEPQRETRNALSKFIGYDDWDDFIAKKPISLAEAPIKPQNKIYSKKTLTILIITALGAMCIFVFVLYLKDKHKDVEMNISFSGKYLNGSSPHTVVFNYNIDDVTDSIYIHYDDDFTQTTLEALDPQKHTITHRYILPDLYNIKLIHKNKAIRTLPVNLTTSDWQTYLGYDNLTKFYPFDRDTLTGKLEANPQKAFGLGLFPKDENVLVKHRFVKDFGIMGDHFRLTASVADLKKLKNLECFVASFVIHGDSGKINVSFAQNDCLEKAYLKFGNQIFDGKHNDLSALTADFYTWTNLEILTDNQFLTIRINGKKRIALPFKITMGKIRAILFDTSLSGAMDFIEFTDTKTGKRYYNTF